MKRIILGLTVIVVAVLATSCSHSSPESVAKAYIKALINEDAEAAADCFYYEGTDEEKAEARENMKDMCKDKAFKRVQDKEGIQSYEINSVQAEGESKAYVHATVTYGNGDVDTDDVILTEKRDGKWYISKSSK